MTESLGARLDPAPAELEVRLLRRAIGALVAAGVVSLFVVGANRPADPYLTPPGATLATTPAPR